jgi:hypothetical protein
MDIENRGAAMLSDLLGIMVGLIILGVVLVYLPAIIVVLYGLFTLSGIPVVLMTLVLGADPPPGSEGLIALYYINYVLLGIGYVAYRLYEKDIDGAPRLIRWLAFVMPSPTRRHKRGGSIDLATLGNELRETTVGIFSRKLNAWRYRKAAEKLQSEAEEARAKAEVARAARSLNDEKENLHAAEKRRQS